MTTESKLLDVYVDETELDVDARHCYLFAAVIPHDLAAAIEASVALKREHGLDGGYEAKWSSPGGDPVVKARLKESLLDVLTRNFTCILNLTATEDKDGAFINFLGQIEWLSSRMERPFINLFYDQDAFRSPIRVRAALDAWTVAQCTTLACLDSKYSVPIQLADLLAGAFRYVLQVAFGARKPKTVEFSYDRESPYQDWRLDYLFHVALRWSIPGVTPQLGAAPELQDTSAFMKSCLGSGIVVNGPFSPEELAIFESQATFYIGCRS